METMLALSIACTALGLFSPSFSQVGQVKPPNKINLPSSQSKVRLVMTGFVCNKETADDLLETDGKGDEITFYTEVTELDGKKNVASRRQLRTPYYGDVNRPDASNWVKAGSRSDKGGIRSGDKYPEIEPYQYSGKALQDRLPQVLWEGTLYGNGESVLIIPTIWESDNRPQSMNLYMNVKHAPLMPSTPSELQQLYFTLGNQYAEGDRMIGEFPGVGKKTFMHFQKFISLDKAKAFELLQTNQGNGPGRFSLAYGEYSPERYTVFFQIETIK